MISIVEPRLDQVFSGRVNYIREMAAASGGEIVRVVIEPDEIDAETDGLRVYDSAWLAVPEMRERLGGELSPAGLLVQELPRDLEPWREALSRARMVIAKSLEIARAIEALQLGARVVTVEPGHDTRLRMMQAQPREHDLLRIITVAHLVPRKGLLEAARCLKALAAEGLEFHWYIFGEPAADPEYQDSLATDESYAERLVEAFEGWGWDDTVTLFGAQGLPQQLKLSVNMDVALFPALAEGYGLAITEAAAMGLPILATEHGVAHRLLAGDAEACLVTDCGEGNRERIGEFLRRYAGRERNVRVNRRGHPLLERTWATAAGEFCRGVLGGDV